MTDKKYKLLEDNHIDFEYDVMISLYETVNDTVRLYRIQAIKDFGDVKAGDIGGWIEKESNLSQSGRCWVGDNAKVFGNAKVTHDALVINEAIVMDCALVYDAASVREKATVARGATIHNSAVISGNAYISDIATIGGATHVSGAAAITDCASAYIVGTINDMAHITGKALLEGSVTVSDNPRITDNVKINGDRHGEGVRIYDHAFLCGEVEISGNVEIFGNANICQNAKLSGRAKVYNNAHVSGDAEVSGDTHVFGNAVNFGSVPSEKAEHGAPTGIVVTSLTELTDTLIDLTIDANIGICDRAINEIVELHHTTDREGCGHLTIDITYNNDRYRYAEKMCMIKVVVANRARTTLVHVSSESSFHPLFTIVYHHSEAGHDIVKPKYTFIEGSEIEFEGRTLRRIRATRNLSYVCEDQEGGYLEGEHNLSQYGQCWVDNNAKVFDRAHVSANAHLFDNAIAQDDAEIHGKANLCKNARASGHSLMRGTAQVSDDIVLSEFDIVVDASNITRRNNKKEE